MSVDRHQAADFERQRVRGTLELLQQSDPNIEDILVHSKFVVTYLLQQDGDNPGWRKANRDGPVYLVRRRVAPQFCLLVKNQFSTSDHEDYLHQDWELDCQKNYVFYKVEDANKRIRGLWFQDDQERLKVERVLKATLDQLRAPAEPAVAVSPGAPLPQTLSSPAPAASLPDQGGMSNLNAQYSGGVAKTGAAQESVAITMSSLQRAWRAMADDEEFMSSIMQKLKDMNTNM